MLATGRTVGYQVCWSADVVHDGKIDHRALRTVQMTKHELEAALRAEGCAGPEDVRFAVLENNGHITVIPLRNTHVD